MTRKGMFFTFLITIYHKVYNIIKHFFISFLHYLTFILLHPVFSVTLATNNKIHLYIQGVCICQPNTWATECYWRDLPDSFI